jgi:hypothetical protein
MCDTVMDTGEIRVYWYIRGVVCTCLMAYLQEDTVCLS